MPWLYRIWGVNDEFDWPIGIKSGYGKVRCPGQVAKGIFDMA